MKAVEYANKVCDYILNAGNHPVSTPRIADMIGIPNTSRDTLLKHMERLHMCGLLEKQGAGKFRWKLTRTTWDRNNPFYMVERLPSTIENFATKSYLAEDPNEQPETQQVHGLDKNAELISALEDQVASLTREMKKQEDRILQVEEESSRFCRILEIKQYDGTVTKLKNVVLPSVFEKILDLAKCRRNILLV